MFFDAPGPDVLDRYYNGEYPAAAASWYNVESDYAEEKAGHRADLILSIASDFGFGQPGARQATLYHEIGCAFGGTVHELNRRGYQASGTELNVDAVAQGRARGNDAIAAEPDTDFLRRVGRRPNVVFGVHVFEHMPDPVGYLRDLASCLATDAIVILFVPNAMTLFTAAYGFMGYPWFAFPGHLNLFSPGSTSCLARAAGYELVGLASNLNGLEPAATDFALNSGVETPVMTRIRDHLVEHGLMAEELVLVLTPAGSPTAARHSAEVAATARRCAANAVFEAEIRDLAETTALGSQFVPRPDFEALLKACRLTLEQRDAELEQCQSTLLQRDAQLAEAFHRARKEEILRQAIETSTFWRATRVARTVVDWLKS